MSASSSTSVSPMAVSPVTLGTGASLSADPAGRELHCRRARGRAEALVSRDARDPRDLARHLDDRDELALLARDLAVDEQVLELLRPAEADRAHAVAGTPRADDYARPQRARAETRLARRRLDLELPEARAAGHAQ